MVGSRRASDGGLRRARALSCALARHDITVVSGHAAGIDHAAHEAAIAASGRTIAVLGTPLDTVYPKENRALQERIGREHLLLSQFPSGSLTTPRNFPIHDRTMVLLTDATVIVETGEQSGTLHKAWEALRQGRLLFLLESVAHDPALTWPKEMIRYGAQVLSRDNLAVLIENLPPNERGQRHCARALSFARVAILRRRQRSLSLRSHKHMHHPKGVQHAAIYPIPCKFRNSHAPRPPDGRRP